MRSIVSYFVERNMSVQGGVIWNSMALWFPPVVRLKKILKNKINNFLVFMFPFISYLKSAVEVNRFLLSRAS